MSQEAAPGRAAVVGLGVIGGSLGLALRRQGWFVLGQDADPARESRALEVAAIDQVLAEDPEARAGVEVTFIATPVAAVAAQARSALQGPGIVTDVAGVKAPVVDAVDHPKFIGGHPMAGSEQHGLAGADPDLFVGATWVLTPTALTEATGFTRLRTILSSLGADVVSVSPEDHDSLVAVVSHVPHLTAAALMTLAAAGAEEHASLLRLAAGGFRDMTRIAAGHPGIWPDICVSNRVAIAESLGRLIESLSRVRELVDKEDREGLLELLDRAQLARRNLPARLTRPEDLVEVRVPVPDRPGTLADITTLAGELGVNIYDLTIAHSAEGDRGTLLAVVDARSRDLIRGALLARGYRPSIQPL